MLEQGLTFLVNQLDMMRVGVLRWTLPSNLLRSIFLNRALRLQILFLLAAGIYFFAALFFPLWVLVIGPILWGIPHIFASIRYFPKLVSIEKARSPKMVHFFFGLWALVTCARIMIDQLHWHFNLGLVPENWPELTAATLTLVALSLFHRKNLKSWLMGVAIIVPLILASWTQPILTAGVLVLLHNWIAFVYWYRSARSRQEKYVVGFSLLVFASVHLAFYFGTFDFLYRSFSPQGYHPLAQLDYGDLGQMIAPGSTDHNLWFHLVSMYAFGQALHYFIWLKAIPDQELPREYPVSFSSSLHYLREDFGARTAKYVLLVIACGFAAWLVVHLPQARAFYFSIAAFHGYMEFAGLGFLKFDKIQT